MADNKIRDKDGKIGRKRRDKKQLVENLSNQVTAFAQAENALNELLWFVIIIKVKHTPNHKNKKKKTRIAFTFKQLDIRLKIALKDVYPF